MYIAWHINFVSSQAAIDVILSVEETYADIVPVRLNLKSPSAYVWVSRGFLHLSEHHNKFLILLYL